MKKTKFFIATLLAVAATSVAVVSCKKENLNASQNNTSQSVKTFVVPQVADMNAYLKDFKQKMKESQYAKEAEMLSLEEAAWHLSSVANYDFANVNVDFNDLFYDTLSYQLNITNGHVALSDFNAVYESMANDIDTFYQSLDLQEKHFHFIGVTISDYGEVTVALVVSYENPYHLWYPSDTTYCDLYFNETTAYPAFGFGMTELERILKLIDSRPLDSHGRTYLVYSRDAIPLFVDHIDPYGSPNFINSRIYCTNGYYNVNLTLDEMCYYLSSYHALGYELILENEAIANWKIQEKVYPNNPREPNTFYHEITITYGYIIEIGEEEEQFGY